MITRKIINPNILYDSKFELDHICSLINRWKQVLYRQGAKKGDLVAISILNVNHWHVSAIFACAELGLRMILLDSPAKKESLPFTKLARFGPARFCLDDGSGRTLYDGLHQEMITQYSDKILTPRDAADWDDDDIQPWTVDPDDPFLVSSTSGTTDFSKMVEFTHKEVAEISERNIGIFGFEPESVVLHTKNMHHASAMLTDLLPSLMVSDRHYHYTLADRNDWHPATAIMMNRFINAHGIDRMIMPNSDVLYWLLKDMPQYDKTVRMNMSGICLGPEYNELCKAHNIEIIQHYGSIETAIPLMTRMVSGWGDMEKNCLGSLPDDKWYVTIIDGFLFVRKNEKEIWKKIGDKVEYRCGKYYHIGRVETPLNIPEDLDVTPFFQDTKINMDQLRGFLMTKKYKENA